MVPPKRGLSESSLTSVADMIDDVFGNDTENVVDFAFLHAILLILTRRLCLMDRIVAVNIKHANTYQNILQNSNKIAVGEIKITTDSAKNGQKGEEKRVKGANEVRDEKILFVERRASAENSTTSLDAGYALDQRPQSIVTREQYTSLAEAVKKLQERFGFTEPEMIGGFYQSASFSDPMAIIQLSARLEAVERAIDNTMKALKNFPSTSYSLPNTDKKLEASIGNRGPTLKSNIPEGSINTILEESVKKNLSIVMDIKNEAGYLRVPSYKSTYSKDFKDSKTSKLSIRKKTDDFSISGIETGPRVIVSSATFETGKFSFISNKSNNSDEGLVPSPTMEEFRYIIKRFSNDMAKRMHNKYNHISQKSTTTKQNISLYNDRLTFILDNVSTMNLLENKVKRFVNEATKLDAQLIEKTSRVYEMLTKTQTEVDVAIEKMNETLAKPLPENEAIPELAPDMDALQLDFDRTSDVQEHLYDVQESLQTRLKVLKKQIYDLKLVKANRDELYEALESKINISTINRMMNIDYYHAVLGKLQKHISDLFLHFNNREISWQAKAKKSDVVALKDDILKNIAKLDDHLDLMISICSEHGIKKGEHREIILDRPCINCDSAPNKKIKSDAKISKKKKQQRREDSNKNKICRPNNPIPHPIHPGSKCVKLCVGSNKLSDNDKKIDETSKNLASSIIVQSSKRSATLKVTNETDTTPCEPCNTLERKKIILGHNLKFTEHEPPKDGISVLTKTSIAQETEKSKDSIISLRQWRSKHDSSRRSINININYSYPHLPDSASQNSEGRTISVLDLDDELSTYL